MAGALRGSPTDPPVARSRCPSRRPKSKQGDNLPLRPRHIAELSPGERLVSEIVVAVDVFVPEVGLISRGELQVEVRDVPGACEGRKYGRLGPQGAAEIGLAVAV